MSETQSRIIRAGELTSEHIGKGIWAPARLNSAHEWECGWRRISMISHTTKGVKVRCANSAHVDHSFAADHTVSITREDYAQ